ncbi:MAG: preprotein translocase subunit SecG [Bacilli bacterium]|jgi:preprotein translocase, secG subunit|nr:preprotein translocase SecG subunit [Firmicutes bacterium CAG:345]
MTATEIILLIISVLLIIITLLQGGKSEGASGAITGGSQMNIFARTKERGIDKILSYITMGLAIVFFLVAILASYL